MDAIDLQIIDLIEKATHTTSLRKWCKITQEIEFLKNLKKRMEDKK